jgi:type I site-specific restriction-modification system R (restriction) subunit
MDNDTQERKVGGQQGNTNSSKINRLFAETIKRIDKQSEGEIARQVAQALIDKAISGDVSAIKEFADRVDGKSVATTELTGVDGSNLPISIAIDFVKPENND